MALEETGGCTPSHVSLWFERRFEGWLGSSWGRVHHNADSFKLGERVHGREKKAVFSGFRGYKV